MLKTLTIFKFPGGPEATLAQVGGKGLSLIKSCESGMPVPLGFVLSVDFFTPWLERLKTSPEWTAFSQATAEQMQAACSALKAATTGFTFTEEQREAIDEFFKDFEVDVLFAVRSSSPEEDLEGASFAGGYETILGVNKTSIESAVLRAFASCLDFRVAAYKREHGFDVSSPKIAVVVQRQIASEVAGVGFSINPLTNNFDEAVINANFGLGETVVAGLATPDTFTVDRNARTVSNKQLGGKETSIWLGDNGGTIEKPAAQKDDFCLTDQQILELSDLIAKVEGIYGKPIDTEWALAGNQFYLLQARPITAYVPLVPNMVTNPGERKSLFLDVTIVVQGLYKPMSPMGTSVIARVLMAASEHVLGQNILGDPHKSVAIVQNGRIYANLSVLMAMFGRDKLAQVVEQMDPTSSQALCELDEQVYKAEKGAFSHPPFHLLMQLPEPILRLLESNLLPEHAHKSVDRAIANFMVETRERAQNDKSVLEVANDVIPAGFKFIFRHSMPLFAASRAALEQMKSIVGDVDQPAWSKIQRALPNNVTTEMGLALYHLALLEPESAAYLEEWKKFVDLYGHRGPEEFDIASARYRDQAQLLHDQIETLRKSAGTTDNPQARFEQAQVERHAAYEELCEQIQKQHGWVQLKRFQALYRVFEHTSGYREMHKYLLIFVFDLLRQRLLRRAEQLVGEGRLDNVEQIFDLTLDDVRQADSDSHYDLRAAGQSNRTFSNRLAAVPGLPSLFDSRGKILRPTPRPPREGEVAGTPISSGVVRGRIKVLHAPDEKPLLRGEILVARATDPGWTPLFVNAAAVILEIGGMLQHGALVAREYGLPCVSGIPNATALWEDGTMVEVDGMAGIIRIVDS